MLFSVRPFKLFLQRCALRNQDFAFFLREYTGFQNPDHLRMLSSGFYIHIGQYSVRIGAEIFKSIRNLIVTKTKSSKKKVVTIEKFCEDVLVIQIL